MKNSYKMNAFVAAKGKRRIFAVRVAAAAVAVLIAFACFSSCRRGPTFKNSALTVSLYDAPVNDQAGEKGVVVSSYTPDKKETRKIINALNSVSRWSDDSAVDRDAFMFVGEIQLGDDPEKVYFTVDGIVYYDHWFGVLSGDSIGLILGLKDRNSSK